MAEYVADAHAIAWHLFAQERLGQAALRILDEAVSGLHKIYLPAVALAEVIMVVEKKRLHRATMQQLEIDLALMMRSANYEFLPLWPHHVIDSRTLTVIPDIFDRLIVAEALRLGLPLITHDTVITNSSVVPVIWH